MMQVNVVNTSLDKYINQAVYSTLRRHLLNPPNKRQKKAVELVPIVFGFLRTSKNTMSLRILLDSGASATLIKASKAASLTKRPTEATKWTTSSGSLPDLSNSRMINTYVHVAPKLNQYDMIIGCDL